MKTFYWKLFLFQTILYGLMACMTYSGGFTKGGKIAWIPSILIVYTLSVIITFVIPMINLYKNK